MIRFKIHRENTQPGRLEIQRSLHFLDNVHFYPRIQTSVAPLYLATLDITFLHPYAQIEVKRRQLRSPVTARILK